MQLIVDSGSTKTIWCLTHQNKVYQEVYTPGINPFISSKELIISIIEKEVIANLKHMPDAIYYYGAGCSTNTNKNLIHEELKMINEKAIIEVEHDLLAVARALCLFEPGIAVILGTGSNSCLYDGAKIVSNTPSLGYVMGDEGSGAFIGKQLISDIWYKRIPQELSDDFFEQHPHPLEYFLHKIYKEPAANAYLASFTRWLIKHKSHAYVQSLLKNCFSLFIDKQIAPYDKNISNKINSIGSIAFYFRDEWKDVILQHGYEFGTIEQSPMQGLIQYHL